MTESDRLIDTGSDEEQALLRAARRERAPRGVRMRVLASVGVATGVAVSAGTASAGVLGIVKWLAAGVIAGTVVSGAATWLVEDPPQDRRPAHAASFSAKPATDQPGLRPDNLVPRPAPPPVAASPERKTAPASSTPLAPAQSPRLAEELASLDRARAALAAGDPRRALRELDRHAQEFPKGALAQEAEVLRIESMLRSGQRPRAASLARRFLELHGRGPHASRVRSLLAQAEASTSAFPPSD